MMTTTDDDNEEEDFIMDYEVNQNVGTGGRDVTDDLTHLTLNNDDTKEIRTDDGTTDDENIKTTSNIEDGELVTKLEPNVMLSSNITCNPLVMMNLLKQETISLINNVAKELAEDNSALFVQIIDQNNLHVALALPNSPIPPGVNVDASLKAFREWVIDGARRVKGDCQFLPDVSDSSL